MNHTDRQVRDIAQEVCTARELEAWDMEARGMSQRSIAAALHISRAAVRDRLESAAVKVARALNAGSGA